MAEQKDIGCTITLHWLEKSRSHRILWLLEELHLPYVLKTYNRGKDVPLAPDSLKKIHPLGKSPVITITTPGNEDKPLVLAESGVIVEYLTEHFGTGLIPSKWKDGMEGKVEGEREEWMRWRYFMHYAEGSLMGLLVLGLFVSQIRESPVPFFIRPITRGIAGRIETGFLQNNYKTHFDFLESQLATSEGDFICGKELTGADILMVFPVEAASQEEGTGMTKEKYPKLWAYFASLTARPAYQRAVQKIKDETGEYVASLREKK